MSKNKLLYNSHYFFIYEHLEEINTVRGRIMIELVDS